jgi:hypothetical protein
MLTTYDLTLDGHDEPVRVSTDQRDLFALRRRGWKELDYDSPEKAMEVFNRAESPKMSDADMAALGLEALSTVTWLLWHAATRNGLTTADFDTFAEAELIDMAPVMSADGNGDAVRPTTRRTSAGGSVGSPR